MSLFGWIRDAVIGKSAANAAPGEIRRNGRRLLFIGFLALLIGLVSVAITFGSNEHLIRTAWGPRLALVALFPGFAAVIVGGYRMFGSEPTRDDSGPGKRIAIGVGLGCGALIVLFALIVAVAVVANSVG